jgi:hypothetical protein
LSGLTFLLGYGSDRRVYCVAVSIPSSSGLTFLPRFMRLWTLRARRFNSFFPPRRTCCVRVRFQSYHHRGAPLCGVRQFFGGFQSLLCQDSHSFQAQAASGSMPSCVSIPSSPGLTFLLVMLDASRSPRWDSFNPFFVRTHIPSIPNHFLSGRDIQVSIPSLSGLTFLPQPLVT